MTQILQERNIYNGLDTATIREAPTDRANAVTCHAVMTSIGYAPTEGGGWQPWHIRTERRYDVQVKGALVAVQVAP